jgi:predicted ArsR family transcriptional regulator
MPENKVKILHYMRRYVDTIDASHMAETIGITHEDVYVELVSLEANGIVRVTSFGAEDGRRESERGWQLTDAGDDDAGVLMTIEEADKLSLLWCAGQPIGDLKVWRTASQVLARELADTRANLKKFKDQANKAAPDECHGNTALLFAALVEVLEYFDSPEDGCFSDDALVRLRKALALAPR